MVSCNSADAIRSGLGDDATAGSADAAGDGAGETQGTVAAATLLLPSVRIVLFLLKPCTIWLHDWHPHVVAGILKLMYYFRSVLCCAAAGCRVPGNARTAGEACAAQGTW